MIAMFESGKNLKWILQGGLLLTPFLVFIVARSLYFPFITGKNFAFRILVEILAVIWVWAALRYPSFRPRFSSLLAAVAVFIAVMGLATIFSLSPYRSFWSTFERMEGYIGLVHLFLYFLLLGSVFQTERDWKIFFSTTIAVSVFIALYAVAQLTGFFAIHQGGTRVDATFGNATYLAAYLVFHLFFLIWFFLRARRGWLRALLGAAFLLELVILYHTATRGAILGALGGFVIFGLLLLCGTKGLTRRWAIGFLAVSVSIPLLFSVVRNASFVGASPVLERFASMSLEETTTQSRLTLWRMALRGWQERPILGWGQESFFSVFSTYYESSLWKSESWFDRTHNVFLDWLTAGGIFGLAAYLGMYGAALWMLIRAWRSGKLDGISGGVFSALLSANFFQTFFVFENLTSSLLLFAVLAYIHHLTGSEKRVARKGGAPLLFPRTLGVPLALGGSFAAALAIVPFLYFGNVRPILAAESLLDAFQVNASSPPAGKVDAVILAFQEGIRRHTFGTTELREQTSQAANALAKNPAIAPQDRMKFYAFAIGELEAELQEFPSNVRAKTFLTALYSLADRPAEALAGIKDLQHVSHTRPELYFIAAKSYMDLKQPDEAVRVLSRAYEIAPDYPEAIYNLAAILIVTGRAEEAENLMEKHYGLRFVPEERLAQAYLRVGNVEKTARVFEMLVVKYPENARLFVSLGLSYVELGRIAESVAAIERAIILDSRFRAEGEAMIQQIRARATVKSGAAKPGR